MARKKYVSGLPEVERVFASLSAAMKAKVAEAIERGAVEVVDAQKTLAPVGKGKGAGELRDSLQYLIEVDDEKSSALRGVMGVRAGGRVSGMKNSVSAFVFSSVFYSRFVEFGTRPAQRGRRTTDPSGRKRKARRTHPGTTARPFFFTGYAAKKRRVVGRVKRAIKAAAKEAAQQGRR